MRVWVTRAQPGADATGERLRALGHAPLVASLLEVRRLTPPAGEPPADTAALAFTSANAVHAFADWTPARDWPVFAVGAATADTARHAGFASIDSADGDVRALTERIAAVRSPGLILHPCATEAAGDLAADLAAVGLRVRSLPLYETRAVAELPSAAAEALAGEGLDAVLLHSPKAARTLASLLASRPGLDVSGVRALGLSSACVSPLTGVRFALALSAAAPTEAALMERLA